MRRALLASLMIAAAAPAAARDLSVPDHRLTPGAVRALSRAEVCRTKWGRDARHVSAAMKAEAFRAYGLSGNDDPACVPDAHGRRCEVDHLVSRELGGADDVRNLWPQPLREAREKDKAENMSRKEVCRGAMTLGEAQRQMALDWRKLYRQWFGEPR